MKPEELDDAELRNTAAEAIKTGVAAADPYKCIKSCISVQEGILTIDEDRYRLNDHDEIKVFGFGKASKKMAEAVNDLIEVDEGIIISNKKPDDVPENFRYFEGDHPLPSERNVEATEEILRSMKNNSEDTLSIVLISGGGSAMLCSPPTDVPIEDVRELNRILIGSGSGIDDINTVRKHVSRVKGGKLLSFMKGDILSLIISDVVGNDISSIASGPTYADDDSFLDAFIILDENDLIDKVPSSIRDHINKGIMEKEEDTPGSVSKRVRNHLVGDNLKALEGARDLLEENGFNCLILTGKNQGDVKEVIHPYIAIAEETQASGNPIPTPTAFLIGGEMTVKGEIPEGNKGGPNREFVLRCALKIQDKKGIVIASADSDGTDGSGKAGAVADGTTISRSDKDPNSVLKEHSTEGFFDQIGDSIEFDSSTNVNDISVILVI
ncbi:MAG: glycerate kinase type-2 family protein [Thermoplasmatota archaeon]